MVDFRRAKALGLAWGLGWRITAALVVGYYADAWLGTTPLLLVTLSIAALVASVRQLIALQPKSAGDRDENGC